MENIIQFLKNKLENISEDTEIIENIDNDIKKLNSLFKNRSNISIETKHLKIQPIIQKGQIWTVKNEYEDFQGITQKTVHPFIVLIINDSDEIEGNHFVRVLILSPFIEMASERDELCDDSSIIGFPFIVELWNNQPMLTELLDEYIGQYISPKSNSLNQTRDFELSNEVNNENNNSTFENLSKDQIEFRNLEISRAKYINHSILSLLSFLEKQQNVDESNEDKKNDPPPSTINGRIIKMFITVSSVAAIIVVFLSIWRDSNKNEALEFSKFEKNSKELLAKLEPPKEEYIDVQNNSRGLEINYKGFSQFETNLILKAKDFAFIGNYKEAIINLEKIEEIEKSSEVSLMLSLIYLNIGNYEYSIKTLEKINSNQASYKEAINYYLGLSYALNGENEKAKRVLKKLEKSNSNYKLLANKLIKLL